MRVPFNGSYSTTQNFNDPCCRASYAKFGMTGHNGIDYGLPCGTQVVAPYSGQITFVGNDPTGYGLYVFLNDGKTEGVLGHLSRIDVRQGQSVSEGQAIGLSGTTGNSSGCHLHFGIRPVTYNRSNGFLGYVDPAPYLTSTQGGGSMSTDAVTKEEYQVIHERFTGQPAPDFNRVGRPLSPVLNEVAASEGAKEWQRRAREYSNVTKAQEQVIGIIATREVPPDSDLRYVGKPANQTNLDAMVNYWLTKVEDDSVAEAKLQKIKAVLEEN